MTELGRALIIAFAFLDGIFISGLFAIVIDKIIFNEIAPRRFQIRLFRNNHGLAPIVPFELVMVIQMALMIIFILVETLFGYFFQDTIINNVGFHTIPLFLIVLPIYWGSQKYWVWKSKQFKGVDGAVLTLFFIGVITFIIMYAY